MVEPNIGDAVLVEWRDAVTSHGWMEYDEIATSSDEIVTVGILYARDDRDLTVVSSHGEDQVNGYMTIPTDWVQKVRVLRRNVVK